MDLSKFIDQMTAAGAPHAAIVVALKAISDLQNVLEQRRAIQRERTTRYRNHPGYAAISDELRLQVLTRDGFQCVYCGSKDRLECDHQTPLSKGGLTTFENLVAACKVCNARKRDRDRKAYVRSLSKDIPRTISGQVRSIPSDPSPPIEETPLTKEEVSKKDSMQTSKRGSRIPDDWTVSDEGLLTARQCGLSEESIIREAAKFRDFWISKPGAAGRKLDWEATWRNWVRNTAEKLGIKPVNGNHAELPKQMFYCKNLSPELEAWDKHTGKKLRDRDGGWWYPQQWPPGYDKPLVATNGL